MTKERDSFTKEGGLPTGNASCFVGQFLLIPFVRGEANCHLRHNACDDCPKPFIQAQRGFPLDDIPPSPEKTLAFAL